MPVVLNMPDDVVFSDRGHVKRLGTNLAPPRAVACHTSRSRLVSSIIPVVDDDNRLSQGGRGEPKTGQTKSISCRAGPATHQCKIPPCNSGRDLTVDGDQHYRPPLLDALSGLILVFADSTVALTWVARLHFPFFHFICGSGQELQYHPEVT